MAHNSFFTLDTLQQAAHPTADTLKTAAVQGAAEQGGKFDFGALLEHMRDSHELEIPWQHNGQFMHISLPHLPPVQIGGITFDFSITKHVLFLLVSAVLLFLVAVRAARVVRAHPVPKGMGNLIELFIIFIRDEVAVPNMGHAGIKYVPYLTTTFLFILIMNLFGLIPFGATPTSNVSVTAGLAGIALIMIQVAAIRAQGWKHYLAHLTGGVHPILWPIMIPIEILGIFTKPFALCVRLFANMTGGHIVILALIGLIFLFRSLIVAPVSVAFTLGINMLELFVAFLQAYVFTIITALLMGLGMPTEHGEEHSH